MKILPLLLGAAVAFVLQAPGQSIDYHFEPAVGVPSKLVWQTQAGRRYNLLSSADLGGWTQVGGFPRDGTGGMIEHSFAAGAHGFYQITSEVTDFEGMVLVPEGNFQMGDSFSEGSNIERPMHNVFVSAFYMAKYEVTKDLWDEVRTWALDHGFTDLPAGRSKAGDHPVHTINWYAIVKWCNARSEKEGLTPCYTVSGSFYHAGLSVPDCDFGANGYRLPTEAEWEKAARGGMSDKRFPWGDTINHDRANYLANGNAGDYDTSTYTTFTTHPTYSVGVLPYTAPVGSLPPNGYGLYDMAGNLWEWCWDRYSPGYYASSPENNPTGPPTASVRVLRGGYWFNYAYYCRVARRNYENPAVADYNRGFRPVRR